MKNKTKTNVMRLLDQAGIPYNVYQYEADPSLNGIEVAAMIKRDPAVVFKTLVTIGISDNYYVFMIPVASELNLKKAAKLLGEKSISMLPTKDLLALTGYVHGGCSPLGMKRIFKTYIDDSALSLDSIIFNAGKIGLQVEVALPLLSEILSYELANLLK